MLPPVYPNPRTAYALKKFFGSPLILTTAIVAIVMFGSVPTIITAIAFIIMFAGAKNKFKPFISPFNFNLVKTTSLISSILSGLLVGILLFFSVFLTISLFVDQTSTAEEYYYFRNSLIILILVGLKILGEFLIFFGIFMCFSNITKDISSPYVNIKGTGLLIAGSIIGIVASVVFPIFTLISFKDAIDVFSFLPFALFIFQDGRLNTYMLNICEISFTIIYTAALLAPLVLTLISVCKYRKTAAKLNSEPISYNFNMNNFAVRRCMRCGHTQSSNDAYCSECGNRM